MEKQWLTNQSALDKRELLEFWMSATILICKTCTDCTETASDQAFVHVLGSKCIWFVTPNERLIHPWTNGLTQTMFDIFKLAVMIPFQLTCSCWIPQIFYQCKWRGQPVSQKIMNFGKVLGKWQQKHQLQSMQQNWNCEPMGMQKKTRVQILVATVLQVKNRISKP